MGGKANLLVSCPSCQQARYVRSADWSGRKSDNCKPCERRLRYGLDPAQGAGVKGTRLHNIWRGMRQRCGLVKGGHAHDIERYRERGIEVCDEWARSCEAFIVWANANGYAPGLYIDRIDVDKGYGPDNCRWVTVKESNRNKSTTLTHEQVAVIKARLLRGHRAAHIAKDYGMSDATISFIKHGQSWTDVEPAKEAE